jgi:acyl dehydratase
MSAPPLSISPRLVGATAGPLTQAVDARWLMAYAAGLNEDDPRYFDTTTPRGPLAHPLFAVCYEWPLAVEIRAQALGAAIAARSVHATHHLVIHRPPRAGDRLTTTARITDVRGQRAGALVVISFETVDAEGAPVTSTRHGSLYRGLTVESADPPAPPAPPAASGETGPARWEATVPVAPRMAHLYTECARIWNPIHTDVAVARAAGLPGIILHGTATLALAVSRVVTHDLDGQPERVGSVSARFTGMVALPSCVTVRGHRREAQDINFDAVGPDGRPVVSQGVLTSCSR